MKQNDSLQGSSRNLNHRGTEPQRRTVIETDHSPPLFSVSSVCETFSFLRFAVPSYHYQKKSFIFVRIFKPRMNTDGEKNFPVSSLSVPCVIRGSIWLRLCRPVPLWFTFQFFLLRSTQNEAGFCVIQVR